MALKKKFFVRKEPVEQVRAVNVAILSLKKVCYLKGLWLNLLALTPQIGGDLRIIYNFS